MLQTILFRKEKFSMMDSILWLMKHGYKYEKVDETREFYRFRQHEPLPGGKYYTKTLANSIEFVFIE